MYSEEIHKNILADFNIKKKVAIITGANGQDGSYLAEFLLEKGYIVYGVVRRSSKHDYSRLAKAMTYGTFYLEEGDVTDYPYIFSLVNRIKPDELYNLAAQSHVYTSFFQPSLTWNSVAEGCLVCLEAIRTCSPKTKFYQASSSEMFGDKIEPKISIYGQDVKEDLRGQKEDTGFNPQSPYAIAKLAAHNLTELYRKSYGLFACSGILFNHESPRRGDNFVTKKITNWLNGDRRCYLELGNINAFRDWSHAKDMVECMWLMLQHPTPDTYCVGSGATWTVQDFLEASFSYRDLDWKSYVKINDNLKRPSEVPYLCCISTKARDVLGWEPKYNFSALVKDMLDGQS
jgi:GDPmannose 4,6-dehydratase